MQNFSAIIRMCKISNEPIVFFPDELERDGCIVCYQHIGQHSSASYDYYRADTKPINKFNPLSQDQQAAVDALIREVTQIYEQGDDAVKLVWKKRITRK